MPAPRVHSPGVASPGARRHPRPRRRPAARSVPAPSRAGGSGAAVWGEEGPTQKSRSRSNLPSNCPSPGRASLGQAGCAQRKRLASGFRRGEDGGRRGERSRRRWGGAGEGRRSGELGSKQGRVLAKDLPRAALKKWLCLPWSSPPSPGPERAEI